MVNLHTLSWKQKGRWSGFLFSPSDLDMSGVVLTQVWEMQSIGLRRQGNHCKAEGPAAWQWSWEGRAGEQRPKAESLGRHLPGRGSWDEVIKDEEGCSRPESWWQGAQGWRRLLVHCECRSAPQPNERTGQSAVGEAGVHMLGLMTRGTGQKGEAVLVRFALGWDPGTNAFRNLRQHRFVVQEQRVSQFIPLHTVPMEAIHKS